MQYHMSFLITVVVSMVVCTQELDLVYIKTPAQESMMYVDQEPFYVNDHRIAGANSVHSNVRKQFYFMDTLLQLMWTETISETIKDYSKTVVLSDCSYLVRFISGKSLYSNLAYVKDLHSNAYYPLARRISIRDDKTFYVLATDIFSITNVDTNNTVLWSTVVDSGINENAKVITTKDNGCLVLSYPYLKKYSPGGSLEWTLQLSNSLAPSIYSCMMQGAKFPNGDFFITLNRDFTGAQLLRITNEGKVVWKKTLQRGSDFGSWVDFLVAKDNRFLLCGLIELPYPKPRSTCRFATLIDTSGNFVWYSYNITKMDHAVNWALLINDSSLFVFDRYYGTLYKFNNPPVFNQTYLPPKPTARIGELYTDTIVASDDFPKDIVRYFSVSNLPGFNIDSITGIIHWIPQPISVPKEKVIIIAQDRLKQFTMYDYFITVMPGENSPPILVDMKLSSNVISEGDSVSLRAIAKDNEHDNMNITWLLNGKDTLSKQIAMMYRSGYKSSHDSIIVTINDDKGNETRQRVQLTVQNKPLPPVSLLTTNTKLHFGDTIAWAWGDYGIDPDLDTNQLLFTARLYQTTVVAPKYITYRNIQQQFIIINDSLLSKMNDTYYPFEFSIEAHDLRYSTGFNIPIKFLFKSIDSTLSINKAPAETAIRINKRTGELFISLNNENGASTEPLHVSILNLQGKTLIEKSFRYTHSNVGTSTMLLFDIRKIAKGMLIAKIQYKGIQKTYVIQTTL